MTPKAVKKPEENPEDSQENEPDNVGPKNGKNTGESTDEKRRTCPFCKKSFSLSDIGNHARWDSKCAPLFKAAAREQYEVKHKSIGSYEIPEDMDPDTMTDQELGRWVRRNKQQLEFYKVQEKLKSVGVQRGTGDRSIEMMLLSHILEGNKEETMRLRRSLANVDDDVKVKKEDHAYELEKLEIQHMHEASMKKWDVIIAEILDTKKTLKPVVKMLLEPKVKEYIRQSSPDGKPPHLTAYNDDEMEQMAKRSERFVKIKSHSTEQQNDTPPPSPTVDPARAQRTVDELPDDPPTMDTADDQDEQDQADDEQES